MLFDKAHAYYTNQRADLVDMLPAVAGRFLEIGCGSGATLAYAKKRGASSTVGVEVNATAAAEARAQGVDQVLVADVEQDELPFGANEFDCIIFADVLEHLYDPWSVLKRLSTHLKDDGSVLMSIPNVKHYPVLRGLLFNDSWTYTDLGVLDSSHVRFFTLSEIRRLLAAAGLREEGLRGIVSAGWKFRILNALLLDRLESFSVVQYYVRAGKVRG